MATIVNRLDPNLLENPDADLRYALPDLIVERSVGVVADDGFDYVEPGSLMVLFLKTMEVGAAIKCVIDVIVNTAILGGDLRTAAAVAIKHDDGYKVVYPIDFVGEFVPQSWK